MLKSDNSKTASQPSLKTKRSEAEKKIEESSKRNPYLPLPPPPLMPHPDEIGENEEEDQEENRKEANEKQDQKESKKQMVGQDFDREEEEFVDGNISDWLEY